jgi:hypothetical protein
MALPDITFVKGQGGLGRPLSGEDFISGLIFYSGSLPAGFSSNYRIKQFFSVADAEAAGITNGYADATAATATYEITDKGNDNDTINFKVTEVPKLINGVLVPQVTDLGTYTKTSADSSATILAASVAAMINSATYKHGYSADAATGTITITAPKKLGIYLNSGTPLTVTKSSTIHGTLTQFANGTASKLALWHYHISEYFRMQPKGQLYVGFFDVPGTYTFTEITTMQNFAQGKIRQVGIFKSTDDEFATADLTAIHTEIVNHCDANHKPLSALYAADMSSNADISDFVTALEDLNFLTASKVSAVIGQDGAGLGAYLFAASGKSVTCLGACLGAVSYASVSDSIEWVGKFNISNGYECDTPAFANGTVLSSVPRATLTAVDNMRYIFLLKYVGNAGTYFNDSHTATVSTSDYAYIENNRTIDKAIRGVYATVLPALGSPLLLNADGTLADTTVAYFTSLAQVNLAQMQRDNELSAHQVTINPTQNVLSTGNLVIAVQLLPVGVARTITVNIGFVAKIS